MRYCAPTITAAVMAAIPTATSINRADMVLLPEALDHLIYTRNESLLWCMFLTWLLECNLKDAAAVFPFNPRHNVPPFPVLHDTLHNIHNIVSSYDYSMKPLSVTMPTPLESIPFIPPIAMTAAYTLK